MGCQVHTRIPEKSLLTQSDATKNERKGNEESTNIKTKRYEIAKTHTHSYETNGSERNLIHIEIVFGLLYKFTRLCDDTGPRFCRHRIISNLFHHFTIYDIHTWGPFYSLLTHYV